MKVLILLIIGIFFGNNVFSQDIAIRKVDRIHRDSLMNSDYPYVLPIYGDRVQKMGHDLPLPFGIMVNYVGQDTDLNIDNIALKLDDSDYVDMGFLEFETFENTANVVNVRLEAWLFPFLNVYGIYAHSESNNAIKLINPIELEIPTNPTASTYGLGTVLAYGTGNYFAVLNFNATWSDVSSLDDDVFGTITSFRLGRSFGFHKRFHNINFSIGVQHQHLDRNSNGALSISEIFSKVDQGKLQEIKDDVSDTANNWYDDLRPAQQVVVNKVVKEIDDWLSGRTPGDKTLGYRFEKEPVSEFSLQLGVQYNHGRRWWYRLETGVGKGRNQIMLSANYRFGINKRK
ncbi:hypothetical protein JM658_04055 [Joostella atrarenae]|uniref:Uncharacterized protein n=1 Tax=Joostella atrarenae TaxID=679257 RepID=A0ABS9J0M8_9FLAO|nr:hypothetical protein [Joostella atrarenae]MCF8713993.1 hypothetical protein [Joostella atrarenae]